MIGPTRNPRTTPRGEKPYLAAGDHATKATSEVILKRSWVEDHDYDSEIRPLCDLVSEGVSTSVFTGLEEEEEEDDFLARAFQEDCGSSDDSQLGTSTDLTRDALDEQRHSLDPPSVSIQFGNPALATPSADTSDNAALNVNSSIRPAPLRVQAPVYHGSSLRQFATTIKCQWVLSGDPRISGGLYLQCADLIDVHVGTRDVTSIMNHIKAHHLPPGTDLITESDPRIQCQWLSEERVYREGRYKDMVHYFKCDGKCKLSGIGKHILRKKHVVDELRRTQCPLAPECARMFNDRVSGDQTSLRRHMFSKHGLEVAKKYFPEMWE